MTPKEHILLLHLFAQQNIFLKQLCDVIKANTSIRDQDLDLFGDFLLSDAETKQRQEVLERTLSVYLAEAHKLGVVTGLEGASAGPQEGTARP